MSHCGVSLHIKCSMTFNQRSTSTVSSVQFSLQSLSPPIPSQPEVQVGLPCSPPPDLVKGDETPGQRTVEVAIPHVGTFVIESEEGGYDDEVASSRTNLLPVWHVRCRAAPRELFSHT